MMSAETGGSPEAPREPSPDTEVDRVLKRAIADARIANIFESAAQLERVREAFARASAEKASLSSRVAQAEADALALIDERDRREEQITAIYHALGGTGEWSSACDLGDEALEMAENSVPASRVAQLEAQLDEAETHIAKMRMPLLHYFGTTDPELLAEVWKDQAAAIDARRDGR